MVLFYIYSTAQTENAKSVSFQGLSQRGINEKSVYIMYVDDPQNNMDMTDRTRCLHEAITDCNY